METTLVHHLAKQAGLFPDHEVYTFLRDDGEESSRLTFRELNARAEAIAARLHALVEEKDKTKKNDSENKNINNNNKSENGGNISHEEKNSKMKKEQPRALLLYPSGPDYICALLGCMYARVIAVPVFPPMPSRLAKEIPRLQRIVKDSGSCVMLTTSSFATLARAQSIFLMGNSLTIIATDTILEDPVIQKEKNKNNSNSNGSSNGSSSSSAKSSTIAKRKGGGGGGEKTTTNNGNHSTSAASSASPPLTLPSMDDIAFLQYSSGSTGEPKGVTLTFRNLHSQISIIIAALKKTHGIDETWTGSGVSWLPMYHDMGLIGFVLMPLMAGSWNMVIMNPLAFLARPWLWLQTITRYRGVVTGAPNFAYAVCANKLKDEDIEKHIPSVDLSSCILWFNGAEPCRAEIMRKFHDRFARYGLPPGAITPTYGLAEATLMVACKLNSTTAGKTSRDIYSELILDAEELERNKVKVVDPVAGGGGKKRGGGRMVGVVSCGIPFQEIAIVAEQEKNESSSSSSSSLGRRVGAGVVGEIWVRGDSVSKGYWGHVGTSPAFLGVIAGEKEEGEVNRPWLKTGDLGFLFADQGKKQEELYVTGRTKDVIIIRGRNLYPQDIERTVENADPENVRLGCVAAVAVDSSSTTSVSSSSSGGESLVVIAEIRDKHRLSPVELRDIEAKLSAAVAQEHGVRPLRVLCVEPRILLKTTSGKIQRYKAREICNKLLLSEQRDTEVAEQMREEWPRLWAFSLIIASFFLKLMSLIFFWKRKSKKEKKEKKEGETAIPSSSSSSTEQFSPELLVATAAANGEQHKGDEDAVAVANDGDDGDDVTQVDSLLLKLPVPSVDVVVAEIIRLVSERTGAGALVTPTTVLANLGISSHDAVSLIGELESKFPPGAAAAIGLSPIAIFDNPTPLALANYIVTEMQNKKKAMKKKKKSRSSSNVATKKSNALDEIGIAGVWCRFPGKVEGPDSFLHVLKNGIDCSRHQERGDAGCGSGFFLEENDSFLVDSILFSLSEHEVKSMHPQQRLLIETVYLAMCDAGLLIDPTAVSGGNESAKGVACDDSSTFHRELNSSRQSRHIGVYVAASANVSAGAHISESEIDVFAITGHAASILANRISYIFGFTGPSMTIDTACSSSLVAVHSAVQALRADPTLSACVVAGVNLCLEPQITRALDQAGFLSASKRCKSFSANADGYVRGDGCGAIVLRRREEVVDDSSSLFYCLISGSAVNQDGRSNGLTAPSRQSQVEVIQAALDDAAITAQDLTFIETHGSATQLGDAIELGAIKLVFEEEASQHHKLSVGSVKSNIGHLEAAAGMAGIIKAALSIRHRVLFPSLHFEEGKGNKMIDFASPNCPFKVQTQIEEWAGGERIYGGVSSFGFGGTNAHVIVSSLPNSSSSPSSSLEDESVDLPASQWAVIPFSGVTVESVKASARNLADKIRKLGEEEGEHQLQRAILAAAAISHSLYRIHFQQTRTAVVVPLTSSPSSSSSSFIEQVASSIETQVAQLEVSGNNSSKSAKTVFVFSGSGVEWLNQGQKLLESEPVFADTWKEIDDIVQSLNRRVAGWSVMDLHKLLADVLVGGNSNASSSAPALLLLSEDDRWCQLQMLTFATQLGLYRLLSHWGIPCDVVVGHSLGEVAAACACGAISLPMAVQIVMCRARWQQRLSKRKAGGMVAVGASAEQVDKCWISQVLSSSSSNSQQCNGTANGHSSSSSSSKKCPNGKKSSPSSRNLCISAVNSPRSCTVSGDPESIDRLCQLLSAASEIVVPFKKLKVPFAAHSSDFDDLEEECKKELLTLLLDPTFKEVQLKYPSSDSSSSSPAFFSSSSPSRSPVSKQQLSTVDYWWRNIRECVYFVNAVENATATTTSNSSFCFLEISSHPVLSSYLREIMPNSPVFSTLVREKDDEQMMKTLVAKWYSEFNGIQWENLFADWPVRIHDLARNEFRKLLAPFYCFDHTVKQSKQHQQQQRRNQLVTFTPVSSSLAECWEEETLQIAPMSPVPDRVKGAIREMRTLCKKYISCALNQQNTTIASKYSHLHSRLKWWLAQKEGEEEALENPTDNVKDILASLAGLIATACENFPEFQSELRVLQRCGSDLSRVLGGTQDPLQLIFPNADASDVEYIYANSPNSKPYNDAVAKALADIVESLKKKKSGSTEKKIVRILELGAGTGGLTGQVIKGIEEFLAASNNNMNEISVEYVFTDISPLFIALAQEKFATLDQKFVKISFEVLNIEDKNAVDSFLLKMVRKQDNQAATAALFDVVLAANVLHATSRLDRSLSLISRLMAPGAALVILEITNAEPWLDLTFGLLDGWWAFTSPPSSSASSLPSSFVCFDPRSDSSSSSSPRLCPLLTQLEWLQLLSSCGNIFAEEQEEIEEPLFDTASCTSPLEGGGSQSILLARRKEGGSLTFSVPVTATRTTTPAKQARASPAASPSATGTTYTSSSTNSVISEIMSAERIASISSHPNPGSAEQLALVKQLLRDLILSLARGGVDSAAAAVNLVVNDDTDLFELGIDSLSLIRLQSVLSNQFGIIVPASVVANKPSIDSLSAYLIQRLKEGAKPAIAPSPSTSSIPRPLAVSTKQQQQQLPRIRNVGHDHDNQGRAYIMGIGVASPDYCARQEDLAERAIRYYHLEGKPMADRVRSIYRNSAIHQRHSVLPDIIPGREKDAELWGRSEDVYNSPPRPTIGERNVVYAREAPALALRAAQAALASWGGSPQDITHVVSVSCTGTLVPGLEFRLVQDLGLDPSVERLGVNFMGCFGTLAGLRTARALAISGAAKKKITRVLLVCTELCTLHFEDVPIDQLSMDSIVGSCLFADGAAATIVGAGDDQVEPYDFARSNEHGAIWEILGMNAYAISDSRECMRWELTEFGWKMGLSIEIPDLIARHIRPFADSVMAHNINNNTFSSSSSSSSCADCEWALHPGGAAILRGLEAQLSLSSSQTESSWNVLRDHGNMSSGTLLFVLHDLWQRKQHQKKEDEEEEEKELTAALAFGPGLSMEGALLKNVGFGLRK